MNIELAQKEHIPQISNLIGSLFSHNPDFTVDPEKQIRAVTMILNSPELGKILVLKKSDEIIGCMSILFTISTAMGGRAAVLEDVIIHPEYRNQGLGAKLLDSAVELAKQEQCSRISLVTGIDNDGAQRFYLRHGFEKSSMIAMRKMLNS